MNDAIAYGLGQANHVSNNVDSFVSLVDAPDASGPEAVRGTLVIRSAVAGRAGEITFSGEEEVIKALALNEIQASSETRYTANVSDAHTGEMIASGVQVTGSTLHGIVANNVDVTFDHMAGIDVEWNEASKNFVFTRDAEPYTTYLHLSDSTIKFQIGANEREEMAISLGDMSARALGVSDLSVTDREHAARSLTKIDAAITKASLQRARLGAYQNRLEHTTRNLAAASTNMKSSESRIRDADIAKEMMAFTKLNILSSAGSSMLAQANGLPQNVLSLLR